MTTKGGQVLNGRQQFIDGNGTPLAGGTVDFYEPGTTDRVSTYQDSDLTIANTNPVVLDAAGMATIYYTGRVRQVVRDHAGNLIWDLDTSSGPDAGVFTRNFDLIADLRSNTVPFPSVAVKGYRSIGDGGEGTFFYKESDTTSADDGGSIIVDAAGHRYYRDLWKQGGRLNLKWWGAVGDKVTDDYLPISRCASCADSKGMIVYFPPNGQFLSSQPVSIGYNAAGVVMDSPMYSPGGFVALTIGSPGNIKCMSKEYGPLWVMRTLTSDWSSESDVGVRIYNADGCKVDVKEIDGFTINFQTWGDETGVQNNLFYLRRLIDGKVAFDIHTGTAAGWNNANRYYGGQLSCRTATNVGQDRFGVRFSCEPGAYDRHNAHTFFAPSFELKDTEASGGTSRARCFYFQADDGRSVHAYGCRAEGCGLYLAQVDGQWHNSTLEFEYVGTFGYQVDTYYAPSATRNGISLVVRHQASTAWSSQRPILDCGNLRELAFRDVRVDVGGTGFEKLAVLSSSPSGPPTNLNGFCFGGLDSIYLDTDRVKIPNFRAIAAVVDCGANKEFFVDYVGSTGVRPVFLQFDLNENLMGEDYPLTLSDANLEWNTTLNAYWWSMAADIDVVTAGYQIQQLQRVRFHPAARYGVIGCRGSNEDVNLNLMYGLRIFTDPVKSARAVYGNGRRWGVREYTYSASLDLGTLAAGAVSRTNFNIPDVRKGDFLEASFSKDTGSHNGGVTITAVPGGATTGVACVSVRNNTAAGIPLGSGTMYVRGIRPKV